MELSPFPYNISAAQDYLPLSRDEALRRGYCWRDADPQDYLAATESPPLEIAKVRDSVTQETLACAVTGKNFRIQSSELQLYRKIAEPLPDFCFEERHRRRLAMRNGRIMYTIPCAACGIPVLTTATQETHSRVLCEGDFQKACF